MEPIWTQLQRKYSGGLVSKGGVCVCVFFWWGKFLLTNFLLTIFVYVPSFFMWWKLLPTELFWETSPRPMAVVEQGFFKCFLKLLFSLANKNLGPPKLFPIWYFFSNGWLKNKPTRANFLVGILAGVVLYSASPCRKFLPRFQIQRNPTVEKTVDRRNALGRNQVLLLWKNMVNCFHPPFQHLDPPRKGFAEHVPTLFTNGPTKKPPGKIARFQFRLASEPNLAIYPWAPWDPKS